jgi:hypothetical protein
MQASLDKSCTVTRSPKAKRNSQGGGGCLTYHTSKLPSHNPVQHTEGFSWKWDGVRGLATVGQLFMTGE